MTDEVAAAARLRLVLDERLGRETPELVRRLAGVEPPAERSADRLTVVVDLAEFETEARDALLRFTEQGLTTWLLRIGLDAVLADERAMREVGRVLLAECDPSDLLTRLGADEFVALVARDPHRDSGSAVAERMRRAIAGHDWAPLLGGDRPVRISVGVAAASPGGAPIAEANRRASIAMDAVRKQGGDRVGGTAAPNQGPGWSISTRRKPT